MSKEEVEKRLGDLKDIAVRAQEFLAASKLRDIENSFNSRHGMTYIEPTYENLKTELWKVVAYLEKDNILYRSVRDIKIFLLLDGE